MNKGVICYCSHSSDRSMEDELHSKRQEEDLLSKRLRLSLDVGVHSRSSTNSKLLQNSSHQRNHSLDFRQSAGEFHPHSHHRNRSLDSVLQQIPECSSSFHQPLHCQTSKTKNASSDTVSFDTPSSSASPSCNLPVRDCIDRTSLASDDSGIFNSDDGEKQQRCISSVGVPNCVIMSETVEVSGNAESVSDEPPASENEQKVPSESDETKSKFVMFSKPPPKESLLLRLFESTLFDMSIAITYLFNSKEPGVQTYLGKYMVRKLSELKILQPNLKLPSCQK